MRTLGPVFGAIPRPVRDRLQGGAVAAADALNTRFVLDAVTRFVDKGLARAAGLAFGDQMRSDVDDFFGAKADPDLARQCFFSEALAAGPNATVSEAQRAMWSPPNRKIALSCAFLSLLSYREDHAITKYIRQPGSVLKDAHFFSVHTKEDDDLCVFVARDLSWAAFSFRGTEKETLRDWFSSALNLELTFFATGAADAAPARAMRDARARTRYYTQMLSACRDYPLQLKSKPDGAPSIFPDKAPISASELALFLHSQKCKVYFTGHSLGGGLATLFGAHMRAWNVRPSAVVTFGSPPVGDQAFVDWFAESVGVSWRFVHGDEFAPMAPPFPFADPVGDEQELRHVRGLIYIDPDTGSIVQDPRVLDQRSDPAEMVKRLVELQANNKLMNIITDHILIKTIRVLMNETKE
jgi:hypothetical protein